MQNPTFKTAQAVVKLVYKRELFDLSAMKPKRIVATINNDGTVIFKEYKSGSRKVQSIYKGHCSVTSFEVLCIEIKECIDSADRLDFYVDDASEELKMYHQFGRVQIVDRGLGNEVIHIGEIMHEFFDNCVVICSNL